MNFVLGCTRYYHLFCDSQDIIILFCNGQDFIILFCDGQDILLFAMSIVKLMTVG